MYLALLLFLAGLVGLWFGSGIVVNAARKIASHLKIPELVIGLTVVSIGTSLPEIATAITAGLSNKAGIEASGIAIGDLIGSNFADITLILGICGLFVTFLITKKALIRESFAMLIAIFAMFFACADLKVTQQEGLALIFLYMIYLFYLGRQEKVFIKFGKKENKSAILLNALFILVGAGIIVYASHLVVSNGVYLSRLFKVKEFIIGLFIGVGTTLPELTISLKAIIKGSKGISLGNLIGSCITNPLLAFGAGAVVYGFTITKNVLFFDFPFLFLTTILVLTMLNRNLNLGKKESVVLIGVYISYIAVRIIFLSS